MKYIIILLGLLILIMMYTKEGFEEIDCGKYKDCKTCATESGCSWCPKTKSCVYTNELKSTDVCNQMNVIGWMRCTKHI